MIPLEHLKEGRPIYEPSLLLRRILCYKLSHVSHNAVELMPLDSIKRRSKMKGVTGSVVSINSLDGLFISEEEAFHELVDQIREDLEKQYPQYALDVAIVKSV